MYRIVSTCRRTAKLLCSTETTMPAAVLHVILIIVSSIVSSMWFNSRGLL
jgi:hypothetical protein